MNRAAWSLLDTFAPTPTSGSPGESASVGSQSNVAGSGPGTYSTQSRTSRRRPGTRPAPAAAPPGRPASPRQSGRARSGGPPSPGTRGGRRRPPPRSGSPRPAGTGTPADRRPTPRSARRPTRRTPPAGRRRPSAPAPAARPSASPQRHRLLAEVASRYRHPPTRTAKIRLARRAVTIRMADTVAHRSRTRRDRFAVAAEGDRVAAVPKGHSSISPRASRRDGRYAEASPVRTMRPHDQGPARNRSGSVAAGPRRRLGRAAAGPPAPDGRGVGTPTRSTRAGWPPAGWPPPLLSFGRSCPGTTANRSPTRCGRSAAGSARSAIWT